MRARRHWRVAIAALASALLTSCTTSTVRDCRACPQMTELPRSAAAPETLRVSSHLITFADWHACLSAGGCGGYQPEQQGWPDDAPVVNVSFDDVQSYLAWLSRETGQPYRLLTEVEWRRVARAGQSTRYPWGDALGRGNANCLDCGSRWDGRSASPVRSFAPNAYGLFDPVGNVAQWVAAVPTDGSISPVCFGQRRYAAIIGASWADPARFLDGREVTCFPTILRDDTIGFRVAVTAQPRSR
jgi:formylglycine-generating enzyme required for sulfatase activity